MATSCTSESHLYTEENISIATRSIPHELILKFRKIILAKLKIPWTEYNEAAERNSICKVIIASIYKTAVCMHCKAISIKSPLIICEKCCLEFWCSDHCRKNTIEAHNRICDHIIPL